MESGKSGLRLSNRHLRQNICIVSHSCTLHLHHDMSRSCWFEGITLQPNKPDFSSCRISSRGLFRFKSAPPHTHTTRHIHSAFIEHPARIRWQIFDTDNLREILQREDTCLVIGYGRDKHPVRPACIASPVCTLWVVSPLFASRTPSHRMNTSGPRTPFHQIRKCTIKARNSSRALRGNCLAFPGR